MSKALVIAEKPSVAQDIVRALTPTAGKFEKHEDHFENEHYVVTSAVGHLVEIKAPEEYDVKRNRQLGNFPQAYSHVGLCNTAFNLVKSSGPAVQRAERSAPA